MATASSPVRASSLARCADAVGLLRDLGHVVDRRGHARDTVMAGALRRPCPGLSAFVATDAMKVVISSTVPEVSVTVSARLSRFLAIWSMETVISSMVAEASVTVVGQASRAGLGHLLDGGPHLGDRGRGLLHVGGEALGVAGHGLDGGRHLLHRGRGLLGGLGLALGALGDEPGVGRDLPGRATPPGPRPPGCCPRCAAGCRPSR